MHVIRTKRFQGSIANTPVRANHNQRRIDVDEYESMLQTCDFDSDSDHSINGETFDYPNGEDDGTEITRKMFEPLNLGGPSRVCKKCKAIVWFEERNRKHKRLNDPGFSICCLDGKVKLPLLQQPPRYLQRLMDFKGGTLSAKFRENIRRYNSMFALTSMGGKIDKRVNNGKGPYIFKLYGQNYHKIGSLLPNIGNSSDPQLLNIRARPRFAQLYIYDTEHEAQNRMNIYSDPSSQLYLNYNYIC
ncbi:hypothetical protein AQUCO_00300390v1 [Aquilegia coerulea]|uniref:Helitron helicase-like domain-containing protein n=1 Tax=Aquilegia coerulea TaxID=218851 RepID=A0A2G5EYM0_AQUCA|nr:hypothetical protein AQUCO_00300390v1 [Aquilegia coerulea]PIA60822.1 hypothetical protein AQUCO_00300390v1 [Aquilegia coerulea]